MYLSFRKNRLDPFHANGPSLYSLKPSENQRFSHIFRGFRKRPWEEMNLSDFLRDVNKRWCMFRVKNFVHKVMDTLIITLMIYCLRSNNGIHRHVYSFAET